MTKFFVAVVADEAARNAIMAAHVTAEAAIAEAVENVGGDVTAADFVAFPVTESLFDLVEAEGGDVDFEIVDGVYDIAFSEADVDTLVDFVIEGMEGNKAGNRGSSFTEWDASTAIEVYADFGDVDEDELSGTQADVARIVRSARHRDAAHTALVKWIVRAGADELAEKIGEADDLDELIEALKATDAYCKDEGLDIESVYDATDDLPIFGGEAIDKPGVYSWDEENVLIHDDAGWAIRPR